MTLKTGMFSRSYIFQKLLVLSFFLIRMGFSVLRAAEIKERVTAYADTVDSSFVSRNVVVLFLKHVCNLRRNDHKEL